eukprot:m.178420 g.178420  ORF g.178420 m.178420 type:complete len:307 (-) comp15466_c0_seq7:2726-3646(-)
MADAKELEECSKIAQKVAREAGDIIIQGRRKGFSMSNKIGVDLVTEVDKACEDLIIGTLKQRFPAHKFIGEETAELVANPDGTLFLTEAPTWLIDPLDGTTNFVTGQNDVVVSIALVVKKEIVMGVIFNPFFQEMYSAVKGQGAYCNQEKISVGSESDLTKIVVMNNLGPGRGAEFIEKSTKRIECLLKKGIRGFRCGGSCAMNMCYVASNRLGLYYEVGYGGPWDAAAGKILIEEAGGVALDAPNNGPFRLMAGPGNVICGNAAVCAQVQSVLQESDKSNKKQPSLIPLCVGLGILACGMIALRR